MMRRKRFWTYLLVTIGACAMMGACAAEDSSDLDSDDGGTVASSGSGATSGSNGPGPGSSVTSGSVGAGAGGPGDPNMGAPIQEPDPEETPECEELDQNSPLVLYLSADDSNSTASPVIAREWIGLGQLPFAVRTYEFLNYYRIDYPAPPLGDLAVFPQLAPAAEAGHYDFQIGVRSFDAPMPRRPMTITLVLDTSGSMDGPAIARERAVVRAIAESLAPGDIVNAVVWDTSNAVLLAGHTASGPLDPAIMQLANGLEAGGGTNLNGGLTAGYQLANQYYGENRLNRLVLISDGGANAGVTEAELIAVNSEDGDKEGIYLVGVGAGPAQGYNDHLMDVVTDEGRGAYVYIDSDDEAHEMFVNRFDEVMEVAARAVQVELTLPWYFQMHQFYGEEYSEIPGEVKPQHLAPSDAMVFNQVLKACDPAEVVPSDEVTVTARWVEPLTYLPREVSVTTTIADLLAGNNAQLVKGKAIVAYAEALRDGSQQALSDALAVVQAANPGGDPELGQIAALLMQAGAN